MADDNKRKMTVDDILGPEFGVGEGPAAELPANASSPPSPESATVTCSRVSFESSNVGICEESAKGSSYHSGSVSMSSRACAAVAVNST